MSQRDHYPHSLFPYQAIVDRPRVRWPNDRSVAIWVIPNIEHFHMELFSPSPDIRSYSRRDYGNRVGIWRLMETLEKNGFRGTVALNGEVARYYPRIVEESLKLRWELMGRGMTNSVQIGELPPAEEEACTAETRQAIEQFGQKMRGWLGPALAESFITLDLLRGQGVEYVADWVNDDLPYRINNGLHSIPYSIELNDVPLFNNPSISPNDFHRRICETFDVLSEEGARNGRVMAIALHPYLTGVPHRIKYLDKALRYIASNDTAWLATGSEIIDAYKAQNI